MRIERLLDFLDCPPVRGVDNNFVHRERAYPIWIISCFDMFVQELFIAVESPLFFMRIGLVEQDRDRDASVPAVQKRKRRTEIELMTIEYLLSDSQHLINMRSSERRDGGAPDKTALIDARNACVRSSTSPVRCAGRMLGGLAGEQVE